MIGPGGVFGGVGIGSPGASGGRPGIGSSDGPPGAGSGAKSGGGESGGVFGGIGMGVLRGFNRKRRPCGGRLVLAGQKQVPVGQIHY